LTFGGAIAHHQDWQRLTMEIRTVHAHATAALRGIKSTAAVRRQPIQERSQDKVQRILAATARLADTMPLDAITMATIAEAAGASFSSIYRFFSSKEAILEAVALASLDRLQGLYEAYFAGPHPPTGAAIIDGTIDIYVAFVDQEPGFRRLWIAGSQSPVLSGRSRSVNEAAVQLAKAYAVDRLGFVATPELDLRLAIATQAAAQSLRYAFEQAEFPRDQVIAEIKRWLRAALLLFG
jgi:AcrR family transcriptional regulator